MKTLMLCLRMVYDTSGEKGQRATGYSYAVRNLAADMVARGLSKIDMISVNDEPALDAWKGVRIIKSSLPKALPHIRPFYVSKWFAHISKAHPAPKEAARILYYYLRGGLAEKTVRTGGYDVVNIQGFTRYSLPYMFACERAGTPYAVSFHALDCFKEGYDNGESDTLLWALNRLNSHNIPCSFISTSMKERAESVVDDKDAAKRNFSVILNGVCVSDYGASSIEDVRKKYDIPESAVVALCCGTINERKNQVQLVRAFAMLPAAVKERMFVLLVGKNTAEAAMEKQLESSDLDGHVILTGAVNQSDLPAYYDACDFAVIPSLSEGFGIVFAEAAQMGRPVLAFADLDAVPDVFAPEAVVTVTERDDASLARGLADMYAMALKDAWDVDKIKCHGARFSQQAMSESYKKWLGECADVEEVGN